MTTWRKGMLAVCVNDQFSLANNTGIEPVNGAVYRVLQVVSFRDAAWLTLEHMDDFISYPSSHFRPAVQDWQSEKQSHSITISGLIKEGEAA